MTDAGSKKLRALGARILSEANDLKRTPAALALDLSRSEAEIDAVISGKANESVARAVVDEMCKRYPISLADLWIDDDNTVDGVLIMRSSESEASSRVFERPTAAGPSLPYYEYRDTAMRRGAPYKPEWIRILRPVQDNDPEHPDVIYNKGHLMHQVTFFIGEVNFYWEEGGRRHCVDLNTGDSNYIAPFVPHTFTSRNPDDLGLIIAITYAEGVRRAANTLTHVAADDFERLWRASQPSNRPFTLRLNRQIAAECQTPVQLADRSGMDHGRLLELLEGGMPEQAEVTALANALGLRRSDLWIEAPDELPVVVRYASSTPEFAYPEGNAPAYRLQPLARTANQPNLKSFNITVLGDGRDRGVMNHSLHEYLYVYGDHPVSLHWSDGHHAELSPGDSVYVSPFVDHAMSAIDGHGQAISLRLSGSLTDAVLDELGSYAAGGVSRTIQETSRWF